MKNKNKLFSQSGGAEAGAGAVDKYAGYIAGTVDPVEKVKRTNIATVLCDMCKDANVGVGIPVDILKPLFKNMYNLTAVPPPDPLLDDLINAITTNKTSYTHLLKHIDSTAERAAEVSGKARIYSNVIKTRPPNAALQVCDPSPAILIHETGKNPKDLKEAKPTDTVLETPAGLLDPGSSLNDANKVYLGGIYDFSNEVLQQYGLPPGQEWKARRDPGRYVYEIKLFEVPVLQGFVLNTAGNIDTQLNVDTCPVKDLVKGNEKKNQDITQNHATDVALAKKMLLFKEQGDLMQILVILEAIKRDEFPGVDPELTNIIVTTTDHVVYTQLRDFYVYEKEQNRIPTKSQDAGGVWGNDLTDERGTYPPGHIPRMKLEIVYTGSQLNRDRGHMHLHVYRNIPPTKTDLFRSSIRAFALNQKSENARQQFLIRRAIAEPASIIYTDGHIEARRRGGVAGVVVGINSPPLLRYNCIRLLTDEADAIDRFNASINTILDVRQCGDEDTDPIGHIEILEPLDLQVRINTIIIEIKTYNTQILISLSRTPGSPGIPSVNRYNIVDKALNDAILGAKYPDGVPMESERRGGGRKFIQSGGSDGSEGSDGMEGVHRELTGRWFVDLTQNYMTPPHNEETAMLTGTDLMDSCLAALLYVESDLDDLLYVTNGVRETFAARLRDLPADNRIRDPLEYTRFVNTAIHNCATAIPILTHKVDYFFIQDYISELPIIAAQHYLGVYLPGLLVIPFPMRVLYGIQQVLGIKTLVDTPTDVDSIYYLHKHISAMYKYEILVEKIDVRMALGVAPGEVEVGEREAAFKLVEAANLRLSSHVMLKNRATTPRKNGSVSDALGRRPSKFDARKKGRSEKTPFSSWVYRLKGPTRGQTTRKGLLPDVRMNTIEEGEEWGSGGALKSRKKNMRVRKGIKSKPSRKKCNSRKLKGRNLSRKLRRKYKSKN